MTEMNNVTVAKRIQITDGVQVIYFTLLAYFCIGAYEYGYLSFYGVPFDFFEINTSTLIKSGISITLLAIPIIILINSISLMIALLIKSKTVMIVIIYHVFCLVFVAVLIFSFGFTLITTLISILVLMEVVIDIILPLLNSSAGDSPEKKIKNHIHRKRIGGHSFFSILFNNKAGNYFMLMFLIITISILPSFGLGYYNAKELDYYPTIKGDTIVIKTYGNRSITTKVDENNNLSPTFKILNLQDKKVTMKRIGKLKKTKYEFK
ncbi:hypothetical protein ACQKPX_10340 [Photobacterium sp. DNB23_23_1]